MVSDARRHAVMVPPWVRDALWARARAVPSLDLDFAGSRSLVDRISGQQLITFTRASSATVINATGAIETVGNDVPRFQHDPATGRCLGLLVEEQRVNSIRNNTMQGAVAGTPGTLPTNWANNAAVGVTFSVIGTGTENGATYIDLRAVAASAPAEISWRFESNTQIAAAASQAWTASVYLKVQSGSLANVNSIALRVREFNAGGTQVQASSQDATVGATLQRFSTSRTLTDATTAFANSLLAITCAVGQPVDVTLRIGLPQLEQGAFATSVIPTTGTAATRSADVATISSGLSVTSLRALYAQFISPASGTRGIVSLNDNTSNQRFALNTSGTDPLTLVVDGGVTQASIDAGTVTANVQGRLAARFNANDFAASFNGGAEVVDTAGTLPVIDRMFIGRSQAGEYLNGPIARLAGWNAAPWNLPALTR